MYFSDSKSCLPHQQHLVASHSSKLAPRCLYLIVRSFQRNSVLASVGNDIIPNYSVLLPVEGMSSLPLTLDLAMCFALANPG